MANPEPEYAIEIHSMTSDGTGERTAQRGEKIVEYSLLCKEYLPDGEIKIHFDDEFSTFDAASIEAFVWEQKWEVSAECIGG